MRPPRKLLSLSTTSSAMNIRRSSRRVFAGAKSSLSMATTPDNSHESTAMNTSTGSVPLLHPVTPSPRKKRNRSTTESIIPTTTTTAKRKSSPNAATTSEKVIKKKSSTTTSPKEAPSAAAAFAKTAKTTSSSSSILLTSDMVAAINPAQPFLDLGVPPHELRPSATLTTGQCFHWQVVHPPDTPSEEIGDSSTSLRSQHKTTTTKVSAWGTHDATEFVGTLRLSETESVVVAIKETATTTLYRPLTTTNYRERTMTTTRLHQYLQSYFQLDAAPLQPLYQEWSHACPRLATIAQCIPGVRIIDQDPWECLISFICSSNNNIPRITKMLGVLRREYGRPLLKIPISNNKNSSDKDNGNEVLEFYSFPSLVDLRTATDADLRNKCGMGYRAKYILQTIQTLQDKGGEKYLRDTLRPMSDPLEVQRLLCEFCGVGPKVADCVALFSLQQDNAIPVDTHVWNIALRDYDSPEAALSSIQSLTPTNYHKVGNVFRQRFPNRAGWAHSLLFVAELPSFRQVLPTAMIQEMDEFQQREKDKKKQKKNAKKEA